MRSATNRDLLARAWPALLTVLVVGAAHLRFLVLDGRPPRDLCNCQRALPRVGASLETSLGAGLGDAAGVLFTPTGWYNLLRLGVIGLVGRSPEALQVFDLIAVVAVVGLSAALAWRWLGPRAATLTALLVGAMPAVVVEGRQGWIHVPEAALVLAAAVAWAGDPRFEGRASRLVFALAGAAAILLRPSGLAWAGSLGLLLLGLPFRRLILLLLPWLAAAAVPMSGLPVYLQAKAEARERYATVLPDLSPQLLVLLGPAVAAVVAVGVLLIAVDRLRDTDAAGRRGLALAAAWLGMAFGLALLFRAGLDNHTLLLPALALLAAAGLRRLPRLGLGLAAAAFAFQHLPQWAPLPGPDSPWWRVPGAWRIQVAPSILNYYVPFTAYGVRQVGALLDAICDGPCHVIVDQGLYLPYGEEPGEYELFAAGEDRPSLVAVHDLDPRREPEVNALVVFDCPMQDGPWALRWPRAREAREQLLRSHQLDEVWATEVGPGCMVRWSTPRRFVRRPEALPPTR